MIKKNKATPTSIYQESNVLTVDKETILLMLYEGAIRFLKLAIEALEKNDILARNTNIKKTMNIIIELRSTLDFKTGGAIAENLDKLYEYCLYKMIEGSLQKKAELLQDALKILTDLHATWEDSIKNLKKK
jgi:flagellar protein FliS